jgi:hypothetical protein
MTRLLQWLGLRGSLARTFEGHLGIAGPMTDDLIIDLAQKVDPKVRIVSGAGGYHRFAFSDGTYPTTFVKPKPKSAP